MDFKDVLFSKAPKLSRLISATIIVIIPFVSCKQRSFKTRNFARHHRSYNYRIGSSIGWSYRQDSIFRRWSSARYRRLLYTDGFTSPMINGEISSPTLYRRFHFADDQRRDIESHIIQTASLRRWSTARYWVVHYIDGFTSPMINGEISDLYYMKYI